MREITILTLIMSGYCLNFFPQGATYTTSPLTPDLFNSLKRNNQINLNSYLNENKNKVYSGYKVTPTGIDPPSFRHKKKELHRSFILKIGGFLCSLDTLRKRPISYLIVVSLFHPYCRGIFNSSGSVTTCLPLWDWEPPFLPPKIYFTDFEFFFVILQISHSQLNSPYRGGK